MNPNGKVIVLTGASSGIGEALLRRLARYDADIVAACRHPEHITVKSPRVRPFACDVSQREQVDALFDFALQTFGRIDLFIANAGYAYCEEIDRADWGHIDQIFRTNVYSPIYTLEKMKELNAGRRYAVVMTCSAVSRIPLPGYALYCSTKAALAHFAHTYYWEKRDKGSLTLLFPVAVSTRFFKKAGDKAPVPFPVHPAGWVAACYMAGIFTGIPAVYPSFFYLVGYFVINRVFPFVFFIYDLFNAVRFRLWAAKRRTEKSRA